MWGDQVQLTCSNSGGYAQVWLAALRETHRQDTGEDLLICEDHFLPEDICRKGVTSDAIPLMPPCLDGQLGLLSAWEVDSSEEDEQWHAGGCSNDREEDEFREERPTAPNPQQQVGVCSDLVSCDFSETAEVELKVSVDSCVLWTNCTHAAHVQKNDSSFTVSWT